MDKKLMLAVAGAGKTSHIINNLSATKRTLIVTYTIGNYNNLLEKISAKFNGEWPENVTVMKYFSFLYSFCYKPFLADRIRAKGIIYESNPNQFANQSERKYQNGHRYGSGHKNWGETKGEDCYGDVCVLLNKNTARKYAAGKLSELPASTRNKLYVAITRAHGNVYFINE